GWALVARTVLRGVEPRARCRRPPRAPYSSSTSAFDVRRRKSVSIIVPGMIAPGPSPRDPESVRLHEESIRAVPLHGDHDGLPDDREIERERPVADVFQIKLVRL